VWRGLRKAEALLKQRCVVVDRVNGKYGRIMCQTIVESLNNAGLSSVTSLWGGVTASVSRPKSPPNVAAYPCVVA